MSTPVPEPVPSPKENSKQSRSARAREHNDTSPTENAKQLRRARAREHKDKRAKEEKERRAKAKDVEQLLDRRTALLGEDDPGWKEVWRLRGFMSKQKELDKEIRRKNYAAQRGPTEEDAEKAEELKLKEQEMKAQLEEVKQRKSAVNKELNALKVFSENLLRQEKERIAYEEKVRNAFEDPASAKDSLPALEELLRRVGQLHELENLIVSQHRHLNAVESLSTKTKAEEARAELKELRQRRKELICSLPPDHPFASPHPAGGVVQAGTHVPVSTVTGGVCQAGAQRSVVLTVGSSVTQPQAASDKARETRGVVFRASEAPPQLAPPRTHRAGFPSSEPPPRTQHSDGVPEPAMRRQPRNPSRTCEMPPSITEERANQTVDREDLDGHLASDGQQAVDESRDPGMNTLICGPRVGQKRKADSNGSHSMTSTDTERDDECGVENDGAFMTTEVPLNSTREIGGGVANSARQSAIEEPEQRNTHDDKNKRTKLGPTGLRSGISGRGVDMYDVDSHRTLQVAVELNEPRQPKRQDVVIAGGGPRGPPFQRPEGSPGDKMAAGSGRSDPYLLSHGRLNWSEARDKLMRWVGDRLSPSDKAKVLKRVFGCEMSTQFMNLPSADVPLEELRKRDDDAVLEHIWGIFGDSRLRRMVIAEVVDRVDKQTGYVGPGDIVTAMVDVASMEDDPDDPDSQLVRVPDYWRGEQQQLGKSTGKVVLEDDDQAMSTRILCQNEKVDKHVSDLDVKVQQFIKSLERSFRSSLPHHDVNHSEKEAAMCLVRYLWNGWMLDKKDIDFKKDDIGLPFMLTEGPRIRGTAYQGLFRRNGVKEDQIEVTVRVLDYPSETKNLRAKVIREALILDSVRHPNIIKFYGACLPQEETVQGTGKTQPSSSGSERKAWIVTEQMKGTLDEAVKHEYVRSRSAKLSILIAVASALDHLHSKRIAHQAISEGNILVDAVADESTGKKKVTNVKLSEFGVSRFVRDVVTQSRSAHANDKTKAPSELQFRAPESLRHEDPLAFPADVWGFAALCIYLFVGRTAARDMSWAQLMRGAVDGELSKRSKVCAERIEFFELRRLCNSCFNHDPKKRPVMRKVFMTVRDFFKAESDAAAIPACAKVADNMRPLWKRVVLRLECPELCVDGRPLSSPHLLVHRATSMERTTTKEISPVVVLEANCRGDVESPSGAGNDESSSQKRKFDDRMEFVFLYPCDESNTGEHEDLEEFVVELREGDLNQQSNSVGKTTVTLGSLETFEEGKSGILEGSSPGEDSGVVVGNGPNPVTFDGKVLPGIYVYANVTLFLSKDEADVL